MNLSQPTRGAGILEGEITSEAICLACTFSENNVSNRRPITMVIPNGIARHFRGFKVFKMGRLTQEQWADNNGGAEARMKEYSEILTKRHKIIIQLEFTSCWRSY